MRQDAGVDGDAQRISQLVWLLFLKVYDAKEELWEFYDDKYTSIIPDECRWRNWAIDEKDGKALTGDDLLDFVNNTLFPALKRITVDETTEKRQAIVKYVFEDANNYMKNGTLLRQVINILNEVDFTEYDTRHAFNDIYESLLRDLQSAGSAGEFYTPRPVTEFMVKVIEPRIEETIADFACGTGGFLISTLNYLKIHTPEEKELAQQNLFGVEKKPLPYLLAITNMILHDIDAPNILHDNSLAKNVRDYKEADKFDVILMNPPYGGTEQDSIKMSFPVALQSAETADLFMVLIMYRLRKSGRVGVVLPDSFLFGDDNAKIEIKKKLLNEFNLHTIVRLPKGVFEPYTDIPTNLLFISNDGRTDHIWYFEHPIPVGLKNYTKTKPIKLSEFDVEINWWKNRVENQHAWKVSMDEIVERNYNLDIRHPFRGDQDIVEYSVEELIVELEDSMTNVRTLIKEIMEDEQR